MSGQIITFYSYKGGTGRTMALANVACLLARQQQGKVLMIDWDLEAPGLHRFFGNRFKRRFSNPNTRDVEFDLHPGLIDLFGVLTNITQGDEWDIEEPTPEAIAVLYEQVKLDQFVLETDIPRLHLLKAGRFDDNYSNQINKFQWDVMFERTPWLISSLVGRLTEEYQYVLIDSRTGLTDTSGICTTLMPEKLVLVFTPNRQSLTGALEILQRATEYRRQSDDPRPLAVFPLASRIELAEDQLRKDWRFGNSAEEVKGYQTQFETLFRETYELPDCHLDNYFNQVQIQHVSRYAYGEEVAVLVESSGDRLSLARAYENFADQLIKFRGPWESEARREVSSRLVSTPVRQDRKYLEALYELFKHFALEDQRAYYQRSVAEYRQAAAQVNRIRALFAFLAGLAAAIAGLLIATTLTNSTVDSFSTVLSIVVLLLIILVIMAPVAGMAFHTLPDMYQWDRLITFYDFALENLEVADARSPLPSMDDLVYRAALRAYVEGTLSVMRDETAQWGQLIKTPESLEAFIAQEGARAEAASQSAALRVESSLGPRTPPTSGDGSGG